MSVTLDAIFIAVPIIITVAFGYFIYRYIRPYRNRSLIGLAKADRKTVRRAYSKMVLPSEERLVPYLKAYAEAQLVVRRRARPLVVTGYVLSVAGIVLFIIGLVIEFIGGRSHFSDDWPFIAVVYSVGISIWTQRYEGKRLERVLFLVGHGPTDTTPRT